ncbi:MAG TPA: hypothetical protein VJ623_01865 [Holophagaceae bacterium]|nr:hypothetical protein [Holophagaceae bacterium]
MESHPPPTSMSVPFLFLLTLLTLPGLFPIFGSHAGAGRSFGVRR